MPECRWAEYSRMKPNINEGIAKSTILSLLLSEKFSNALHGQPVASEKFVRDC